MDRGFDPFFEKLGQVKIKTVGLPSRFLRKITESLSGCWEWLAYKTKEGYGQFGFNKKVVYAHRFAYETLISPIPPQLEIDHLCRNPACVNPDHLEIVTHRENDKRGIAGMINGARQKSKTHCPQGHSYDFFNTYITKNGYRICKMCNRIRAKEYQRERRLKWQ